MDDNDRYRELGEPRQLLGSAEEPAFIALIGPAEHIEDLIAHDIKKSTDVGFDFSDVNDVRTAVYQTIGAASVCWENLAGAGVFESTRAAQLGEGLVNWLIEHGFPDGPGR